MSNLWLLRPLLAISRQQIEQSAAQYQLNHIEDESNQDDSYDRNFLRLEIIPQPKTTLAKYCHHSSKKRRIVCRATTSD
ncbi:hypothetical protein PEC18_09905 [Paucibacter sp. O1-1]|nr:hypothetical protein [Paucibacter sp. O1-1]MDA3826161.1 hypothetical protein [Paucibacter sp. O1-1]